MSPIIPTQRASADARPRLSAAFGGGGVFGIGYSMGVASVLMESGIDLGHTQMIGTSAGSWTAAAIATGTSFERLRDVPEVTVPNFASHLLRGIATEIFGDKRSPLVTASVVQLPRMQRVLLHGGRHRLADMVAASSAVPGLFRPVVIGGKAYVDGGVRSMASANLAASAEDLIVIAPIAGPMLGPGGRAMELLMRRELARWQRTNRGRVHLIRPNSAIAALVKQPMHLFDKARAEAAYPMAQEQTRELLELRPSLASLGSAGEQQRDLLRPRLVARRNDVTDACWIRPRHPALHLGADGLIAEDNLTNRLNGFARRAVSTDLDRTR